MNFLDVKSVTIAEGDVKTIYINGNVAWKKNIIDNTPVYIKLLRHSLSGSYKNESVTSIGDYAFYYCEKLTRVEFTEAISIGDYAFYNCSFLTAINFPKATTIGESAFENCIRLSKIRLPLVTEISGNAFKNCTSLTTAIFDANVTIGNADNNYDIFDGCNNMSNLILYSNTLCPMIGNSLVDTKIASGDGFIYVPSALIDNYKIADGWSNYASNFKTIEDNIDIIGGLIS